MKSAVVAIVANPLVAECALDELFVLGFTGDDISLLFRKSKIVQRVSQNLLHSDPSQFGVGGLAKWLIGMGVLSIPRAGTFIAAGHIFDSVSELITHTSSDGLSGIFMEMWIPEEEATLYADKLEAGNILIAAHTESKREIKMVQRIFERAGAAHISVTDPVALHH
jgi:hypothetical protein